MELYLEEINEYYYERDDYFGRCVYPRNKGEL